MAFQRGFYSSLFAESHILDSQSQNDMNFTKKVSLYNIASEASNIGKILKLQIEFLVDFHNQELIGKK